MANLKPTDQDWLSVTNTSDVISEWNDYMESIALPS